MVLKRTQKYSFLHTLGPLFYILSQIDVIFMGQYAYFKWHINNKMLSFC